MYSEIWPDANIPISITTEQFRIINEKKLNNIFILFDTFSCDAQKFIIAVSKANMQIVNKYCQKDSSRFIFAMASGKNFAV